MSKKVTKKITFYYNEEFEDTLNYCYDDFKKQAAAYQIKPTKSELIAFALQNLYWMIKAEQENKEG